MSGGVHRAAAGTKAARQIAAQTSARSQCIARGWRVPALTEIELWNAAVDAKKAAKKAAKNKQYAWVDESTPIKAATK